MTFQMRVYYEVQGSHTHIKIFCGPIGRTLGNAGKLVLSNEEFEAWKRDQMTMEFIEKQN